MNSNKRLVRVFINPKSGVAWSADRVLQALNEHWDADRADLTIQFSHSIADGKEKTRRAVGEEVDTVLVVGGDGMINSIGSELIGTPVALGVIPVGSGNGFARHFNIPLQPEDAARALAGARRVPIDVGTANDRPFFVTCSMAWDAAIVRTFEKFPVRGIVPYIFAAAYEFFEYDRQPFKVILEDRRETLEFPDPLVCTVANLTQYGGQARIAPHACPDDGFLELIVMARHDTPRLLANIHRLFDGTIDTLPGVLTRKFNRLTVQRVRAAPIQLDGELVDAPPEVRIGVLPKSLTVLVPNRSGSG